MVSIHTSLGSLGESEPVAFYLHPHDHTRNALPPGNIGPQYTTIGSLRFYDGDGNNNGAKQ